MLPRIMMVIAAQLSQIIALTITTLDADVNVYQRIKFQLNIRKSNHHTSKTNNTLMFRKVLNN